MLRLLRDLLPVFHARWQARQRPVPAVIAWARTPLLPPTSGLVWIGPGADRQRVRLLEVLYHGGWYRYLTHELDPQRLPVE